MNKLYLLLLFSLLGPMMGIGQNACFFPGDDNRWDHQFLQPGVKGGAIRDMLPLDDGTMLLASSAAARFGGATNFRALARWDGEKYLPLGKGLYGVSLVPSAYALAKDAAGNIYVGGNFTGGENTDGTKVASRNVIKWNQSLQVWEAIGEGLNKPVQSLVIDTDTLYVGGEFDQTLGSSPMTLMHIARYYLPTQQWDSLGAGIDGAGTISSGYVFDMIVDNAHRLIAGGSIDRAGGLAVNSIARWTPGQGWDGMNGGLASFQINASGNPTGNSSPSTVQSLTYHPGTGEIWAGGYFGEFIGSASIAQTKGFARWSGGSWTLVPGIGLPFTGSASAVHDLEIDTANHRVFIGGTFYQHNPTNPANNAAGNGVMAYNYLNGTWDKLQNGITSANFSGGTVYCIAPFQGKWYVGGSFGKLQPNGSLADNLAAYTGSGWDNLGDGVADASQTYDLVAYQDGFILAGGFSEIDSQEISRLAMWNPQNGWQALNGDLFGNNTSNNGAFPYSLFRDGNDLYVGGQFGGAANVTSTGLLKYNLVNQTWSGWGTGLDAVGIPRIFDFTLFQGELYAAGNFTQINGVTAKHLAKLTPNGWVGIADFDFQVNDLENVGDSILYVAGAFNSINGSSSMYNLAQFDGTTWSPIGQGCGSGNIYALTHDPATGDLYVGGSFQYCTQSSGTQEPSRSIARWDGSQWSTPGNIFTNAGFSSVLALAWGPDGTLYFGGDFSTLDGQSVNHLARWNPQYGVAGFGSGITPHSAVGAEPVEKVILVDSFLYVIGNFHTTGLQQANKLNRYLLDDPGLQSLSLDLGPDRSACGPETLDAGAGAATYLWNTGATSQTLLADTSGTYFVTKTLGNCALTDTVVISINPVPVLIPEDTVRGCDQILVSATPGFNSYLWCDGSTDPDIMLDDNTTCFVTVTDAIGCTYVDSFYVEIEYAPLAAFSDSVLGDTAIFFNANATFNALDYQWDFGDGTQGSGPTATHIYTSNDSFLVRLIVTNECGQDTLEKWVVIDFLTGLDFLDEAFQLRLYPNPVQSRLHLQISNGLAGELAIQIIDLSGKKILIDSHTLNGNEQRITLEVDSLPAGIYLLRVITEKGQRGFKLWKQ